MGAPGAGEHVVGVVGLGGDFGRVEGGDGAGVGGQDCGEGGGVEAGDCGRGEWC